MFELNTLIGGTIANSRCFREVDNHDVSQVPVLSIPNCHIQVPTFWMDLSCLENHLPDALSASFTFPTSLFHRYDQQRQSVFEIFFIMNLNFLVRK